jgi:hypothetical protein
MISGPDYKEKLGTIVSHLYKAVSQLPWCIFKSNTMQEQMCSVKGRPARLKLIKVVEFL